MIDVVDKIIYVVNKNNLSHNQNKKEIEYIKIKFKNEEEKTLTF